MSIYGRASGRYAVLIDLESSATGLRRRKSVGTFRTRKEAEAAERKALDARDRGIDLSPKTVTVAQLLDRFLAGRRAKGRALRTVMRYDELAKFTIAPHIGGIALAKLSPAHVSCWLATIKERGSVEKKRLAPKSVSHAFSLLRSALRWAIRHDLAWRNVADAVDAPSAPRSQARALDENEAVRFFTAADATRWGPFFRLALGSAMRRGEILALRWEDIMLPEIGQATVTAREHSWKAKVRTRASWRRRQRPIAFARSRSARSRSGRCDRNGRRRLRNAAKGAKPMQTPGTSFKRRSAVLWRPSWRPERSAPCALARR